MPTDDPYVTHHVIRETRPPDRMHRHDPHLAGLVFEYVRTRLTFTDTPLDHPDPPEPIMAALDGFIDEYGRDPREVLDAYVDHTVALAARPEAVHKQRHKTSVAKMLGPELV